MSVFICRIIKLFATFWAAALMLIIGIDGMAFKTDSSSSERDKIKINETWLYLSVVALRDAWKIVFFFFWWNT